MKEFMMDIPFEIPVSRVHLLEHRLVDVRGIRLDALLVLLATGCLLGGYLRVLGECLGPFWMLFWSVKSG
jgi:hypothetical protein